ncbi:uncharacterized protein AB675_8703 [Cyphellophora attinorum]|uniref:Uncharacterized protein n=1 Tax=Cyphellophora attinorum TaxID=1664694 RepID=A0A0N0NR17_9EURO|nr:uncharacterized protein AB675_8703 [Phialophora attinorum]KPI44568.1 hypothetical protein AB675_8703 [Phialophora attinorum]
MQYAYQQHVREVDDIAASQLIGNSYADRHSKRYGTPWTGVNTTATSGVQPLQPAVPSAPPIAHNPAPNPPQPTQGPSGLSNTVASASDEMDIDIEGDDRSQLMTLATETRMQTIRELVQRKTPDYYGLTKLVPETIDRSLFASNRKLRHETFDYLAKQVLVIKLDIHTESDFDLMRHEMSIAAIPFLRVPDDLDTDKTISLRTTSVHMVLEIANEGSTHRNLFSHVHSVVTCIYEYRTFRELVEQLEIATDARQLQRLAVTYTNRESTPNQDKDILDVLDILSLLRGIPNAMFFGFESAYSQMVAQNMQRPAWVEACMLDRDSHGLWPIDAHAADFRLLYVYHRILQAMDIIYLESGNQSRALQELGLIEAHISRERALFDDHDDPLWHDLARYASDCCNLLLKKLLLVILSDADREQKLAAIASNELNYISELQSDELGARHTQAFRAEEYAVSAAMTLWSKRIGEVLDSPESFMSRFKALEEAADETARAVAMYHPEWAALKELEQSCLRWLRAFPDEVAAEGRRSIWFGYRAFHEEQGDETVVADELLEAATSTFEDGPSDGEMFTAEVRRLSSIVSEAALSFPVDIPDPYIDVQTENVEISIDEDDEV